MEDPSRTTQELIEKISCLQQRIDELEHAESELMQAEEELGKFRMHFEEMVKERTADLEVKNAALQAFNTAFKVLLKQREDDKREMEEQVAMNVQKLVLPFVELLKKEILDAGQHTCIDIIETHLHSIAAPLLKNVRQFNLTPRELKVAALVKNGRKTREIAKILSIGTGSIDIHRNRIRKKLGLTSRKANLQSHLETLNVTVIPSPRFQTA